MIKEDQNKLTLHHTAIYHINRLYRYRSMKSKELQGIFNAREIYLPNPILLNDPFECRPNIVVHEGRISREFYIKDLAKKLRPNFNKLEKKRYIRELKMILTDINRMNEIYEDFINKLGIYCLSEIKDDILMWSHYADGHRGLCLEFDTTKVTMLFDFAFKVSYSETYPSIDIINIGKSDEYRKATLTKSKHWEYEQEWRILKTKEQGGPGIHSFEPELLTGVIFGALIPPEDKDKVIEWIKNYPTKINLYQAKINRTRYQLDIESI